MLAPGKMTPPALLPEKSGIEVFKPIFCRNSSESSPLAYKEYWEPDVVKEIFEEESAMLTKGMYNTILEKVNRSCVLVLTAYVWVRGSYRILTCDVWTAVQGNYALGMTLSYVYQEKKVAMEGKRHSGSRRSNESD